MITKMTFTDSALPFILEAFGKQIDSAGYVADKETGAIITNRFGEQLTENNFGGIYKGEYYSCDLWSIMNLVG